MRLSVRLFSLLFALGCFCPMRGQKCLIPDLFTAQYAGNIATVSLGAGWDYGRHDHWETHLLLGYLPEGIMPHDMFTLTLRQCLVPWHLQCGRHTTIEPALWGLAANTIMDNEFWYTEPRSNYYNFSTKLRFHLSFGSRIDLHLPRSGGRLSAYYELSTYDLAIVSAVRGRSVTLSDIVALGFGLQYKLP